MYLTIVVLLACCGLMQAAKIILTAVQFESHILEQVSIADELIQRGHQLYMAVGSRYPKRENIEKYGIKTLQYKIPNEGLYGVSEEMEMILADLTFNRTHEDIFKTSAILASGFSFRDCACMMEDQDFLATTINLDLDLAIVDTFAFSPCNLILPKYLNITFVSMSSFFLPWHVGISVLPSFFPIMTSWNDASDVTFSMRLTNTITFIYFDRLIKEFQAKNVTLLKRYAPKFETWNDLQRKSELFLVEMDHHFDSPVPAMPNLISVAGHTSCSSKKLPENFEKVMESSPNGVVLLSFGSSAKYLPKQITLKFLETFSKLNQTVLTKLFISDDITIPKNIKVFSWSPQNDILGHPRTKLFITHCGNNGQHEALFHGVPMIGFPLFAEQHANCHRIHVKGFGLEMNIHDFTSDELYNNMQEVLNNPKYRSTIGKASKVFRDQPMTPRERGAFWIEHVIKHGGSHLRSPALDMPVYEFLMLDIIFLLIVFIIVVFFLIMLIISWVYRRFCISKQSTTKLKAH